MYQFLVNPASRSGKGRAIWETVIEPALTQRGIPFQVHFSQKPGDICSLARQLAEGATETEPVQLVILGGDGTFNEVVQGLAASEHVLIGYIPTGSSNDLARDMNISKDPMKALERILSGGKPVHMDMGVIDMDGLRQYFTVSTGIGFDAAVCEEAMSSPIKDTLNRLGLGKLTYLGIALKQLFSSKPVACDISLDGGQDIHIDRILFVASMTHRFEGGGFKFCPDAKWDDGLFDLCVVGSLPRLFLLFALPTAFFGKHYLFRGIDAYRAKDIRIRTSLPLWVHTDGEVSRKANDIHIFYDMHKISLLC